MDIAETLDLLVEQVAWEFNVSAEEIRGEGHRVWLANARYAVVWLARRHTTASGADIATSLRCHLQSTVWWHRRARELVAENVHFRHFFEQLDVIVGCLFESANPLAD